MYPKLDADVCIGISPLHVCIFKAHSPLFTDVFNGRPQVSSEVIRKLQTYVGIYVTCKHNSNLLLVHKSTPYRLPSESFDSCNELYQSDSYVLGKVYAFLYPVVCNPLTNQSPQHRLCSHLAVIVARLQNYLASHLGIQFLSNE